MLVKYIAVSQLGRKPKEHQSGYGREKEREL